MALLKQSTARVRAFLLVQSADHLTGVTGAAPTVTISKNGAAFGAAAGAVAELTNGWYTVSFTTADTNTLGDLAVHVTGTGADPSDWADEVLVDVPGGSVASVTGAVGSVTGAVGSVTARVTANTDQLNGTALTGRDIGASVLISSGSGAGQLDVTSGVIKSNLSQILGTALTETAGQIAAAFKQFFNIAGPTGTVNLTPTTTNVTNDVGITQAAADKAWSTTTRALTDKIGFALSAAGVQAIWDALTSALTTVGSIGKRLADDIDATISSRSTYAGGDTAGTTTLLTRVPGVVPVAADYTAARATKLDNLDAAVSSRGTSTLTTADTIGADVKKINGTTVNGNGTSGTPWGP